MTGLAIDIVTISESQFADLLARGEGHFLDFKAKEVSPGKLTKALSAFANADGGELFIGVLNSGAFPARRWVGFENAEAANGHVQTFEQFFPLGSYFKYQFLKSDRLPGLLLHCEILKTPDIRTASDGVIYLRRGAQNLPQATEMQISRLRFAGESSGRLPQWRCLKLANVRNARVRDGRWHEGGSHKTTQKCVTGIDLDVNIHVRKLR